MSNTQLSNGQNSTIEHERLAAGSADGGSWAKWGPYLSERQWGTVREDYSAGGDAWSFFSHDQAASRAYHWGEDGIAGISDDEQRLCFSIALWNEQDPILKERLFGLTNGEGNHGEDVKEYYYYLDNTPTHSYMRYLYKYPQRPFPYNDLVATNSRRSRDEFEYELIDTGVFDEDRYFDVFVEYAKDSADEMYVRVTAHNRGPDPAPLHVLPTLWFRNTWAGGTDETRPRIEISDGMATAEGPNVARRYAQFDGSPTLLACDNESNTERLWGTPNTTPFPKDGIANAVVHGDHSSVNPEGAGTKMAGDYALVVPPGASIAVRVHLSPERGTDDDLAARCDSVIARRRREADDFYASITPPSFDDDQRLVYRQSLAGMLWTKQYYGYDVGKWIDEHGPDGHVTRNGDWFHFRAGDIISMPDKWEYPWFAAWDLAFHAVALSLVDVAFAKHQLSLMLDNLYLHPNGQIAAYEWNFGDVNPPVHAWATIFLYNMEKERTGINDVDFLKTSFNKLLLNFTWWVNRKDADGKNVFEGGFLGLDNIGVFDRSAPLPTGGTLEQADGTAWMALYCQNMLQIALELAMHDDTYEDMAAKFIEHFLWISSSMHSMAGKRDGLWDEDDGFYYDVLRFPDGSGTRLRVRSMVGLLPLAAATVFEPDVLERFPSLIARIQAFAEHHPGVVEHIARPAGGENGRVQLALLDEERLHRVLRRMLDETEFLSPYGLRALSRQHLDKPYVYDVNGAIYDVQYLPAESNNGMFGGNSNWRGPVWFPVNAIIIRALINLHYFYGDRFQVECPVGSGQMMNLLQVSRELEHRLMQIFLRDKNGRRPVFGGVEKFQTDQYWRDHLLFYEYFHGDNGAGLGASHQTGWTGLVAPLMLLGEMSEDRPILGHQPPPQRRTRRAPGRQQKATVRT